jgi:hypothetical protein
MRKEKKEKKKKRRLFSLFGEEPMRASRTGGADSSGLGIGILCVLNLQNTIF